MMNLKPESLTPFGIAVTVPSANLSADAYKQLVQWFRQDGLLVVRGLRLTHEEQVCFCRNFGPVHESPFENFLVSNVEANGHLGTRELLWHNDVPYLPSPYLAGTLHALRVAPGAVGTRFASGFRAYEHLPQNLRDKVAALTALQVRERVWDRPNRLTDLQAGDMCTVHPVVRKQSGSGRLYLFVNEDMTACVIGLTDDDSQSLLQDLYDHFYAADNVYEHAWEEGDLVMWDNLALQHARGRVGSGARTLQRVTITEFGYAQQYPADAGIYTSLGNATLMQPMGS